MEIDIMQLKFIDMDLRKIVVESDKDLGIKSTITSLFRIGDNGNHGQLPLRALDKRCRDKAFGDMVADKVNKKWIYDPRRPHKLCCICHDTGKGLHLHFQSHPNTIRRPKGSVNNG